MDIKLYYTPQTRATRPRWLLEELNIPYTLQEIDLFAGETETPEYKKIHPLGSVPAIEINGEVMFESGAICHWLADYYEDSGLAPSLTDIKRIEYEQWMFFAQATLETQPELVILHSKILDEKQRVDDIVPWALNKHKQVLEMLEQLFFKREYLLGDEFSAADIMLGSVLMMLPSTLASYPELTVYVQRLKERTAYQKAIN